MADSKRTLIGCSLAALIAGVTLMFSLPDEKIRNHVSPKKYNVVYSIPKVKEESIEVKKEPEQISTPDIEDYLTPKIESEEIYFSPNADNIYETKEPKRIDTVEMLKIKVVKKTLEERIFIDKIRPEDFEEMTKEGEVFYDLHKKNSGDVERLVWSFDSPTARWYNNQLKTIDNNWILIGRFKATESSLGRKEDLLYMAADILSEKNAQKSKEGNYNGN